MLELVLLQFEGLSSKLTKLPAVPASNNRDHIPCSPYYCFFVSQTYECHS